jgi:hypothetical protein
LLWDIAALYMDIGEEDAAAHAALKAFVHMISRYLKAILLFFFVIKS